jgi:chaperone modulatory protein CbpM
MIDDDSTETLVVLSERHSISRTEIEQASGLSSSDIVDLVEVGVLEPQGGSPEQWQFSAGSLVLLRRAHRLQRDFELGGSGLALALTYLQRIEELEARIRALECQLPD